jgi:hypothetical protein
LSVQNPNTGAALAGLGVVELNGDDANGNVDFTGSQMTASGNVVTILLGAASGQAKENPKAAAMVWWAPSGAVTESGALDPDF